MEPIGSLRHSATRKATSITAFNAVGIVVYAWIIASSSTWERFLKGNPRDARAQTPASQHMVIMENFLQAASKSYIKVTTIKHLAQLLNGADFVAARFSVDILGALLKTSTHIDIRVAIVESLMSMLSDSEDDESAEPLGNQILQALQPTIPVAGGLSEKYQVQEEHWVEVKKSGKLPVDIEQDILDFDVGLPPVLKTVIGCSLKRRWAKKLRERIIPPIVEMSITNNTR
jgi:hypothetical protein